VWLTAEALRARSKEFWIEKYSELCELRASVVKKSSCFAFCGSKLCLGLLG